MTILPDALSAATQFPELVRDVIDYALSTGGIDRAVDLLGTNKGVDAAIGRNADGVAAAIVNHNREDVEITIVPLLGSEGRKFEWMDIVTRKVFPPQGQFLRVRVPAGGFRAVEFKLRSR